MNRLLEEYNEALREKDYVKMASVAVGCVKCPEEAAELDITGESYWGICPVCLEPGVCLHVGRTEWFVCHKHKVKWCVGSNLFSSWHDMTQAEFDENAKTIEGYREAEPVTLLAEKKVKDSPPDSDDIPFGDADELRERLEYVGLILAYDRAPRGSALHYAETLPIDRVRESIREMKAMAAREARKKRLLILQRIYFMRVPGAVEDTESLQAMVNNIPDDSVDSCLTKIDEHADELFEVLKAIGSPF